MRPDPAGELGDPCVKSWLVGLPATDAGGDDADESPRPVHFSHQGSSAVALNRKYTHTVMEKIKCGFILIVPLHTSCSGITSIKDSGIVVL